MTLSANLFNRARGLCAWLLLGCQPVADSKPVVPAPPPVSPHVQAAPIRPPDARVPPTAEARRLAVEHSLRLPVRFTGTNRDDEAMALSDRMKHHKVPGVSIAVVYRGEIDWAHGYGVRDASLTGEAARVDADTLFQAASISKPLSVLAALKLVEQGKLDLDADINRYLRSWKIPDNEFTAQQPVTLRHLASHTGGTTVSGFPGYASDRPVPTLVQVLDGTPPANTPAIRVDKLPGGTFRYSGGGTTIVQLAMTEVTGRRFDALLHDFVLEPLGMRRSRYEQPLSSALQASATSGHDPEGKPIPGRWHIYPELAAAGLWTTPSDLAKVVLSVQNTHAGKSRQIISTEMMKQALSFRAATAETVPGQARRRPSRMSLGFFIDEGTGENVRFRHSGGNEGFACELIGYVEGDWGAVIMTNGSSAGLMEEIIHAIVEVYRWPDYPRDELTLAEVDPASYERLVGRYEFSIPLGKFDTVAVERQGDRLVVRNPKSDGSGQELYPITGGRFLLLSPRLEISFDGTSDKPAQNLAVHAGSMTLTAKRAGKPDDEATKPSSKKASKRTR